MARPSVDELIERAAGSIFMTTDLVGSGGIGGGLLNIDQTNTFIKLVVDQPTILNEIRVVPMGGPAMRLNKIVMTDRLLHKPGGSITPLADTDYAAPDTSYVDLNTQELVAEVRIPYDVLEDNIEKAAFEQTIMELVAQKVSMELEELLLLGDKAHHIMHDSEPESDVHWSATDMRLAQDGVLKLADAYSVDYATPPTIDENVFATSISTLPSRYQRLKSQMRIYTSFQLEFDYTRYVTQRVSGYGDAVMTSMYNGNMGVWGTQLRPCALMPAGSTVFCDPKNIIMGIQRRITIETFRIIGSRVIQIVLTLRIALGLEDKYGVVVVNGIY
jgi:hypothetical protein